MPAQTVVVHDDPGFLESITTALRTAGFAVAAFADSMSATDALEQAHLIEVLITRMRFPSGTPNGVSLARTARVKRPGVKVLFVADPEMQEFAEGVGEFLPRPVTAVEVVAMVKRMLDEGS